MKNLSLLLIGLLSLPLVEGCENMAVIKGSDCWVFVGDSSFRGRITESSIDGRVYIRKGECKAGDLKAALELTK